MLRVSKLDVQRFFAFGEVMDGIAREYSHAPVIPPENNDSYEDKIESLT